MSDTKTSSPKAYPKYKNTEIPELGEIPDHWELIRLGNLGSFSKGSGGTKEDEVDHGLPCIRYGDLYTYHKYFITKSRSFITPQNAEEYTPIEKGDILFTTSDVSIKNVGKSAVNLMDSPVYCGPDLIILRATKLHHHFAGYLLDSPYAQAQKARMQRGVTIMHIYTSQLADIPFGVPPPDEQAAIVRYLDDADQRIRDYVNAKERLITLLEEERQAVIYQAVTRGLEPNVELKPSGVEWLGEVPKHWQLTTVKRHYQVQLGKTLQPRPNSPDDVQVPYLKAQHVHRNDIRIETPPTMWATPNELKRFGIRQGDVLIVEGGAGAGTASLLQEVPDGYIIQNAIHRVRPKNQTRNELLTLIMEAVASKGWIDAINNKATIPHFTKEKLDYLPIALPPITEQKAIVESSDKATTAIEQAIVRARRQVELMEEYRTRLIADVVTGKMDVR